MNRHMKQKENNTEKKNRMFYAEKFHSFSLKKKAGIIIALLLTAATVIAIPIFAWFSYRRSLGDMQYVDSPTKLYITAAHGEEIKYLDLADISITKTSDTSKYYVFAVCGSNASTYNLQLAFTTNNQFEYFIYPATEHAGTPGEGVELPHPIYITHTDSGTGSSYYYTIDKSIIENPTGTVPHSSQDYRILDGTQITRQGQTLRVTAEYLNKRIPENAVIDATDAKHTDTYSAYNVVQDCAEPIYWQARNIKSDMNPTTRDLLDYYILEVNWEKLKEVTSEGELVDNGETDIVYITVDSSS